MPELETVITASVSENTISIEEMEEMDYMYSVLVDLYE